MGLVNPYKHRDLVEPYAGTRLLKNDFGLVGAVLYDPVEKGRLWTVQNLYAPLPRAGIGGIRIKCTDQKGFISFLNQRDLELLLGIGEEGGWCDWMGKDYPEIGGRGWYGFCCDDEDLIDDLFDREMVLRAEHLTIPANSECDQLIHFDRNNDAIRTYLFLWDCDPMTGISPDTRLETLKRRWVSSETNKVIWSRL